MVFIIVVAVSVVVLAFVFFQASEERLKLSVDLQYRTQLLADGLKESIEPLSVTNSTSTLQRIIERFENRERLVGLALYNSEALLLAASEELPEEFLQSLQLVPRVMDRDESLGEFLSASGTDFYVFAEPLHQEERVIGAFVVVQNAGYINESILDVWQRNLVRLLVQIVVLSVAIAFLIWLLFLKPLRRFAESVKSTRLGGRGSLTSDEHSFFDPLANEITKMSSSLVQARSAASEEARMRLEKLDTPWTAERLQEFIKAHLKDRPIYVVSNREPYVHEKVGRKEMKWSVPASGLVTALEPVMVACGGVWLAHGSGNADKQTADANGKLRVPPDEPKYTLKRVWLSREDEGHGRFSNEALWPLSHMAHTRPVFREEDWTAYRRVNGKFAKELLKEIKNVQRPLVLVQDFHFTLLPSMIKAARPDAQVGLFWHIPWPSAELFSICPWRKEILEGMLGADIIGFHTQQYCNNFMDTVAKTIEARVDFEHFSVTHTGHASFIKPFPISIAFTNGREADGDEKANRSVLEGLGVRTEFVGLGVDRLDYTKGILERFKAIEFLFDMHPEYMEKFTLLQIAPISRGSLEKYQKYSEDVTKEAERINARFTRNDWNPIVLEKRHFTHDELKNFYRIANVCLVTSLHDGMNLVAKEFVAARDDEAGVLILSQMTGAARDLKGALLVNPYSAEEMSEAMHTALQMPEVEQRRRIKTMRETVKNYNVYRWSAELIKALTNLG
ncbi:hypothetical protein A2853_01100 [Candidatus Kaiserbacteria bacterium RIFCSPHIGHO2_01_FULL_55_17]|uniref:Uncharacterized protein n=1 Tax=Candidatus Kaiserbacteria bacterium RIFCSPHIGHO2_01_FULL_55_17 TaxID=1798484 RepID=A0A1F6D9Q4_9BACT|nr:MAG: hypothetical protein A2853_01100 [Candidatus Kaiserbacteria bacterium RIFCSPHIGHO2_01_FULL_55_17]